MDDESREAFEAFMDENDSSWRYAFHPSREFWWELWEAGREFERERNAVEIRET